MKQRLLPVRDFILKNKLKVVLIIFAAVFGIYGITLLFTGDVKTVVHPFSPMYADSQVIVTFGEDQRAESDILEVKSIKLYDDHYSIKVKAKQSGSEKLSILLRKYEGGKKVSDYYEFENIRVGPGRLIRNKLFEDSYLVFSALLFLLLCVCLVCFADALKNDRYSYKCIFYLAISLIFILILGTWFVSSVYSLAIHHTTASRVLYTINQNLVYFVVMASLPLTFIYAVTVTVSNIVLMAREGVRPANTLGIATGAVMAVGIVLIGILTSTPEKSLALTVVNAVASSLYIFFEAVLLSSIFCGLYASRFTPSYDKDYIIILGCRIRPDGTLYPLIRGRVDKAIGFYKTQLEKTGRAACFVPSGGQGTDEIMPEAQAMKNYLLEQGIPEELILPETRSTTTRENMQFSKEIIDGEKENASVIFSTTSYHVFRSGIIASEAGIKIDGIGSKTKWYFWPNAFLREVAGLFLNQPKVQIAIMLLIALVAGAGTVIYSLIQK